MSLDIETHTIKRNVHQLRIVLRHYKLECEGLETLCIKDQILSSECANKIVGWAVSYHLMQMQNPNPESTIVLSQESINHGFGILQSSQSEPQNMRRSQKDIVAENEFEASLLANVIPPSETGVTFDDIGALEAVKDTLKELIMLPLKRPELFRKAKLTKPVL
jgi:SpoVK/Ycf46/Vps4 family AAA+-type ATPase